MAPKAKKAPKCKSTEVLKKTTNRCVKKDSATGRRVLAAKKAAKTRRAGTGATKKRKSSKTNTKGEVWRKGHTRRLRDGTLKRIPGRYVKKSTGRKSTKKSTTTKKKSATKKKDTKKSATKKKGPCKAGQVRSKTTGRCHDRSSPTGKRILAAQKAARTRKARSK